MSDIQTRSDAAVWFEIPATDFERSVAFYESLFATKLRREEIGGARLAVFPYQPPGVGGAVMEVTGAAPSGGGPLVYLNCDGRLDEMAARVALAGGTLAGPMVELPPGMGRFIHVVDPDGNRVGLHSR